MLVEESLWIKKIIKEHLNEKNFPLLNIGSSTSYFREVTQPHINQNIFIPIQNDGYQVIHTDIKSDNGVDIVGDLNDKTFRAVLAEKNVKSVLCSNLLEHLEDPQKICDSILDLLPLGGLIIVTVPYSFPYHKDPIDTLFRPTIKELHAFFPKTEIVESEIVISGDSYKKDLIQNRKYFFTMMARWVLPFYKFTEWKYMISDLFKSGRKYSSTCVLLKKVN